MPPEKQADTSLSDTSPAATDISPDERQRIRTAFPGLAEDVIFLENGGGTQVAEMVADRIRNAMLRTFVQLGGGYPLSVRCGEIVEEAREFARLLLGASDGQVILGPSATSLFRRLAESYGAALEPGQEVIVAGDGHESNIGPWGKLRDVGIRVTEWKVDPSIPGCGVDELERLVSTDTAVIAATHVSNVIALENDVARIASLARSVGARVVVDGVAWAPHRAVDVTAWDVDYYVISAYKLFGPHLAILWGRDAALAEVTGPNHFFVAPDDLPHKFEPGGVSLEACAGLLGVRDYLGFLGHCPAARSLDRESIERAYETITASELPLQRRLVDYLSQRPGVRIVGTNEAGPARCGAVSFVHESQSAREIAEAVDRTEIAIRRGHFYSHRLCQALGIDPGDGVVRVSPVHYNTPEEIDRLIEVLDGILASPRR